MFLYNIRLYCDFVLNVFTKATKRVPQKKVLLEISENSWKTHALESLIFNFFEKRLQNRFFPRILQNIYKHLFYRTPLSDFVSGSKENHCVFTWKRKCCCLFTRIRLNSIFHGRVHTFVCIVSIYSRYFETALLLKKENREVSSGNIFHID